MLHNTFSILLLFEVVPQYCMPLTSVNMKRRAGACRENFMRKMPHLDFRYDGLNDSNCCQTAR